MGGTKKGIHHFLKWPPLATMPGGLGYSVGFVRIAGLFIKMFCCTFIYELFMCCVILKILGK